MAIYYLEFPATLTRVLLSEELTIILIKTEGWFSESEEKTKAARILTLLQLRGTNFVGKEYPPFRLSTKIYILLLRYAECRRINFISQQRQHTRNEN